MFEIVFSAMDEGAIIQNGNAEITAVNPTAERMLGIAADELIGRSLSVAASAVKTIHEDGSECPWDNHPSVITSRTGQPLRDEVRGIYRADGTLVWLAINTQPLVSNGATAPYAVATLLRDITERNQMEQAVAVREQEFRSLAESSLDSIIRYDLDGRIRYLNRGLLNYFGLSAGDVIGKRSREVWPDGRYADIDHAIALALETGKPATVEFCEADAAGKLNFSQVHVIPERDVAGQIIGTIGYGRNVTAIREAERKLKHFIDNLPGMAYTYRLSPDGHACFPFISPSIEKFYGLKPEDVQDDMAPLHRFWHPDDRTYIEAAAVESARTMTPFHIEARVCRPGLPERWLEARALPERETDGSILWHGLMLDITEQKQAEDALRVSERKFRTLAESMPDNLMRFDRQCRVQYINPAMRTSLAPEVLGKSYTEAFPGIAPMSEHQRQLERLMETGEGCELEIRLPNPQGEMRIHHVRYVAERDEHGEIVGALSIARDITERKFAEQYEQFRSHILELLSAGDSLPAILENIVRGVEQLSPGMSCSILLLEGNRLCHGIAPSLPDFYNAAIEGVEIGVGIGSCGTAAASGQRVVVENIQTHPYWAAFKELAAKAGLGSCWSQPVLSSSGQVLGTFAIYHHEVHTPSASDISIIEQAAHLASIAIERKLAEQQLKQALEFSEGIINAIPDILFEMDRNGTYLNVWTQNPELLAAQKQALLGKNVREVLSHEAAAAAMDAIRKADENGTAAGKDICIDLPQGRFWFSHSLAKKPGNTSSDATFMVLSRDITERKQAEALLVQREREFRSLSENLPDNIVRYNREGVTVYVNSQLERTLGDHAATMIGTTPREFYPDGAYEDYAQLLDAVLASGEAGELEKTMPGPDGQICVHQIRMVPERGENGDVVGVVAIGRDITELKRAELERQARAFSLECLDKINKAIQGTTDLDQMMRDVLDIVLARFGCDRAFLLYPCDPDVDEWKVPMERTRPEYPGALALGITTMRMDSEAAKTVRIVRDASGPVTFGPGAEYPLPPSVSGNFGFKSEMLMAVHPKLGKPWIFGIHQCADARGWTENETDLFRKIGWRLSDALTSLLMYRDLRASERQFRTLAENMPFILVRYDCEGRRTYVNPTAERNFGFLGEQVIGKTLPEINPLRIPTVEAYQRALKHTLSTGERSEFEMQVTVAAGDVRIGNTVIVVERDANGEICGAITIGRDITKLKQTERQLRELAAHLQSAREEEKAHLARELHDDLGQILFLLKLKVSGYAHDCMANSGAICGQLQDAQILTDRAIGTARNIVAALRPPALDYGIAAALKWLVENFVANMNVQCELQIEDEEIRLDESKSLALFRIVQEALNNVAKHAQADRVQIVLNKESADCVMRVLDNGTGFDTSKKKKGSFGLVGMQERALMHGGTVSIESRAGGGTEIVVRLPAD